MGHKIAEAIIENGKLKYIDKKLPDGKIKVHIIYDIEKDNHSERDAVRIINETSGMYKNIDAKTESKKLRKNWERDAR